MTIAAGAMTVIATGNSLEVPRRSRRVFALGRAKSIHKALADREGFEPSNGFHRYTLSRRAPSTTRPPVRAREGGNTRPTAPGQGAGKRTKSVLIQAVWGARARSR